jgi:hypothetical protein
MCQHFHTEGLCDAEATLGTQCGSSSSVRALVQAGISKNRANLRSLEQLDQNPQMVIAQAPAPVGIAAPMSTESQEDLEDLEPEPWDPDEEEDFIDNDDDIIWYGGGHEDMFEDEKPRTKEYISSGCQQLPLDAKAYYILTLGMTVGKCFSHCRKRPGTKFFGITRGHECFCAEVPLGNRISDAHCDTKCAGNPSEICGGVANIASVYNMIDCGEMSQEELEKAREKRRAKWIASFSINEGESCGQSTSSKIELDGSSVMAASPQDCAVACWEGKGAENCHGFTYDEIQEKCTFHADVLDGATIKKKRLKCYFKKVSIDL